MFQKQYLKRFLCFFICLLSITSVFLSSFADPRTNMDENYALRAEYAQRIAENQQAMDVLEEEKTVLQKEVEDLQLQIGEQEVLLDELDAQIESLEFDIESLKQQLSARYDVYYERVREVEERGKTSYWTLIFDASSLSELVNRIACVNEVLEYDQNEIIELESIQDVLNEKKLALIEKQNDRGDVVRQLRISQSKLNSKIEYRIAELESLSRQNRSYETEIARLMNDVLTLSRRMEGLDYKGTNDPKEIYQRYVVESGELTKTPLGAEIVEYTLQFLGGRYIWGGSTPADGGFDCSGLMHYVYGKFGYSINRTARPQYAKDGKSVSKDMLQAGDMVFFRHEDTRGVEHVGMYIGDGYFIHAANRDDGIKISDLQSRYWSSVYLGAKRVI